MPISSPDAAGRFGAAEAAKTARFFDGETAGYIEDLPTIKAFARRTGSPLLELGCGTGRLLIPLARSGFTVAGIDTSPAMLEIARSKTLHADISDRMTLIEGNYQSTPLGGPYRFAFIVMNTFMHLLSQAEQLQALRHWHAHLAPGGLLLIDVLAPDVAELAGLEYQVQFDKSWQDSATGATVIKQVIRGVDQAEQLIHLTMLYDVVAEDGRLSRTVVPFDLRYVWRFEAELLLERARFVVEGVYGDWELAPFDSASERLILVAHRE